MEKPLLARLVRAKEDRKSMNASCVCSGSKPLCSMASTLSVKTQRLKMAILYCRVLSEALQLCRASATLPSK